MSLIPPTFQMIEENSMQNNCSKHSNSPESEGEVATCSHDTVSVHNSPTQFIAPYNLSLALLNILPSYQMYMSTIGKSNAADTFENEHVLPEYENSVVNNQVLCNNHQGSINEIEWQNTLLNTSDFLLHMSDVPNNNFANCINIQIHFTKDICEIGCKPKLADHQNTEYSTDDLISGYILISNISQLDVPFGLMYVTLEGKFSATDSINGERKTKKFLDMVDLHASVNNVRIDRLINEHDAQNDPIDNTRLHFNREGMLHAQTTYKRFFTFKLPEKLLDSNCSHTLASHTKLPPTLGVSLFNTSISYSVNVKIIGKESMYSVVKSDDKNRHVILQDSKKEFRVIGRVERGGADDWKQESHFNALVFDNLKERVDENLKLAEEHVNSSNSSTALTLHSFPSLSRSDSTSTSKSLHSSSQSIRSTGESRKMNDKIQFVFPLRKLTFGGSFKYVGSCAISTHNTPYFINYIKPKNFRKDEIPQDELWNLNIPIRLESLASTNKLPNIRKLKAELVATTVISEQSPIPIDLNHEMFYENAYDNTRKFEDIVIKPMRAKFSKLKKFSGEVDPHTLRMNSDLYHAIKCLSELKCKSVLTDVPDIIVETTTHDGETTLSKDFSLKVNLTSAKMKFKSERGKAYDNFCLVPSFQSCNLVRFYYLSITITINVAQEIKLKVPIIVEK